MKKKALIFIVLFSLLIINGADYQCYENIDYFENVERYLLENYNFVQNGVKIEYITDMPYEEEKDRIVRVLSDDLQKSIQVVDNNISYSDDMLSCSINVVNDDKTKVEITMLNNYSEYDTSFLRQAIEKIRGDKFLNERFYRFSKVKIDEENNLLPYILEVINEDTIEEARISNGRVIKADFIDGSRVNLGEINYNTGRYLIIGTPIIFVTY